MHKKERADEDAAALIAVLAIVSAQETEMTESSPTRGRWGSVGDLRSGLPMPAADAWWASGLPR